MYNHPTYLFLILIRKWAHLKYINEAILLPFCAQSDISFQHKNIPLNANKLEYSMEISITCDTYPLSKYWHTVQCKAWPTFILVMFTLLTLFIPQSAIIHIKWKSLGQSKEFEEKLQDDINYTQLINTPNTDMATIAAVILYQIQKEMSHLEWLNGITDNLL